MDNRQHIHVSVRTSVDRILEEIAAEVCRAEEKFPTWPDDLLHGVAIMAEESGEAVKAVLEYVYQDRSLDDYRKEIVQTAAMCIRILLDLAQPARRKQ